MFLVLKGHDKCEFSVNADQIVSIERSRVNFPDGGTVITMSNRQHFEAEVPFQEVIRSISRAFANPIRDEVARQLNERRPRARKK